ncbi:hypothetical protein CAPTEDRAFT_229239 [Capitella teleta]|uniref:Uncharacterized protein n=1 Tax=Capitella teleta TaxID=283909 RepID=R7VCZ6_CAPTE|nr:hypothetical protein CAPTEDRAFT_229239 [Capitella teleta]|eukprot:ELU13560.1 hypothetical protein CAPTEDRAFT_229239 [Capitella teleta]
MAGLNSASDHAKLALILLGVSGLFFIIAFGAPYWSTRSDGRAGLWEGCVDGVCYERWNQWVVGWVKVCQGFMTFAFICWFFSGFCTLIYVLHKDHENDKRLVCAACILISVAAFCVFVAVVTWVSNATFSKGEVLNWAYAVACAVFPVFGFTGYILLRELRRRIK